MNGKLDHDGFRLDAAVEFSKNYVKTSLSIPREGLAGLSPPIGHNRSIRNRDTLLTSHRGVIPCTSIDYGWYILGSSTKPFLYQNHDAQMVNSLFGPDMSAVGSSLLSKLNGLSLNDNVISTGLWGILAWRV
jgi:hypothetical protein